MKNNESGFAPVLAVLAVTGILVLGSFSIVGAANNAIPGDILYPIDTGIESAQLGLTNNPQTQVDLRTQFMAERLREAQQILQEQGPGAPGIDVALSNLAENRTQVSLLASQNTELQARVKSLEGQLQQNKKDLDSTFQSTKENLEKQLEDAKKSGNIIETKKTEGQLKSLETQKETLDDDEDETEQLEAPEQEEPEEPEESEESEEEEEAPEDGENEDSEN